jgi:hypothetical protein
MIVEMRLLGMCDRIAVMNNGASSPSSAGRFRSDSDTGEQAIVRDQLN